MERIAIGEVSLEVLMAGEGPPLLFLHGGDYFQQNRQFIEELASTISPISISTCSIGRISGM